MTADASTLGNVPRSESGGLWALASRRLARDKVGVVCFAIVIGFVALACASALRLVAADWSSEIAVSYAPPSFLATTEDIALTGSLQEPAANAPASAGPSKRTAPTSPESACAARTPRRRSSSTHALVTMR